MIHMLSAFDLTPGEDFGAFQAAYADFVADLEAAGLIAAAGPLGRRVADTPMDTDAARTQQVFSVLSFRDREQLDSAYAHIAARHEPATGAHLDMYRRTANAVFLCWQDQPSSGASSPASA